MRSSRITSIVLLLAPPASAGDERQERQQARALYGLRQLALLLGRDRRDPARHDLAALRDEALQQLDVLVVDLGRVGPGERAALATPEERAARCGAAGLGRGAHHSAPSP